VNCNSKYDTNSGAGLVVSLRRISWQYYKSRWISLLGPGLSALYELTAVSQPDQRLSISIRLEESGAIVDSLMN
jgi:hypothetical protein